MKQQPLFIRIAAVASAVLLVAALICVRAGMFGSTSAGEAPEMMSGSKSFIQVIGPDGRPALRPGSPPEIMSGSKSTFQLVGTPVRPAAPPSEPTAK